MRVKKNRNYTITEAAATTTVSITHRTSVYMA